MKKQLLVLAALGALTACAASAHPIEAPIEAPRDAGLECEVRFTPTRNGLLVESIATAGYGIEGEYQLTLSKRGRNGSSEIVQGGPFELEVAGEATLSASEFNLERGDRYSANLELFGAAGLLCSDRRSS